MTLFSEEEKAKAKRRVKESKDMVTKRQKKVMEKVRQSFSKAVISGIRSGSRKIVYEFFENLTKLWGGSARKEPLPYGVEGDDFGEGVQVHVSHDPKDDSYSLDSETVDPPPGSSEVTRVDESNENDHGVPCKKGTANCVPKLIDRKRKHMEKQLSAAKRDQLRISEAKEDAQFPKDLALAMRESTESFDENIKNVIEAVISLGAGVCRSIEMLSHAIKICSIKTHCPEADGIYTRLLGPQNQQDPGPE